MKRDRVLLVEDSPAVHAVVQSSLSGSCDLTWAVDLAAASRALDGAPFELMLLDVRLPDGDGFAFCAKLRADPRHRALAIMFLTGEADISQRVYGLELGADDYLTKPFAPQELAARVNVRLRAKQGSRDRWQVEAFTIDLAGQRATVQIEGVNTELSLTPIEFKLLAQFLRNIDAVLSREELIKAVWGESVHVALHTVDTHISSLRKKIGPYAERITAVVKRGYCFHSLSAERTKRRA